jgi:hypothetical protein
VGRGPYTDVRTVPYVGRPAVSADSSVLTLSITSCSRARPSGCRDRWRPQLTVLSRAPERASARSHQLRSLHSSLTAEALPRAAERGWRADCRRRASPRKNQGANTITGHNGLNPTCPNTSVSLLSQAFGVYRPARQTRSGAQCMLHLSGGNDRSSTRGRSPYPFGIDLAGRNPTLSEDADDPQQRRDGTTRAWSFK